MTVTSERTDTERPTALCRRLLGPAWLQLHPAIRRLHLADGAVIGRFEFRHGHGLGARLTRWALRLSSSETALDARLTIVRDAESERWVRAFDPRVLVTIQRGLPDARLAERFGALEFRFHLRVIDGALTYVPAGVALTVGRLRVSLPRWIAPRVEAREAGVNERGVHVQVRISAPGIGLLMSYAGRVEVERS